MRPPLVKSQTTPESGFLAFFPPSGAWRSQQTVSCSDLISVHGCHLTWRHQTRIEVLSPPGRRLQNIVCECSATEKFICSLIPSYAKIGLNASTLSSEHQARVRSSTRRPLATSAVENRSESGGPIKALGSGHGALEAPWRALTQGMQPCRAPL